jgi:sRNA-binding regulator protein Hfq
MHPTFLDKQCMEESDFSVQEESLDALCEKETPVYVFTLSGGRLNVVIVSHDDVCLLIANANARNFKRLINKVDIAFVRPVQEPKPKLVQLKTKHKPKIVIKKALPHTL